MVNPSRITERIPRLVVLVIGDFNRAAGEALAVAEFGGRVRAAGLGLAAVKKTLAAHGVAVDGIGRSRRKVMEAALENLAAADVVLFAEGDWEAERAAVLDAERMEAAMDGRSPRPVLARGDARYRFLRTPRQWAAFALALAAGAGFEDAKEFAGGYKSQNSHAGRGRRSGAALPRKRNTR